MVRADYQSEMEIVFNWYMEVFASLLDRTATRWTPTETTSSTPPWWSA
jgi:hypothetical protein